MTLYCSDMGRIGDSSIAKNIDECLHQTMNRLVSTVQMWHLECLPDEAVNARCIQRVLADVVAILGQAKRQSRATLKPINSIQIDNLRPVDAHEVLKTLRV